MEHEGWKYNLSATGGRYRYYNCNKKRVLLCPASIKVDREGLVTIVKGHIGHRRDNEDPVTEFRRSLVRRAINDRISLRDIYDEESAQNAEAAAIYNFPRAENTMRSARRRHNPPIPDSLVALGNLMNDAQWHQKFTTTVNGVTQPFLQHVVDSEAGQALIFASQILIDTIIGGVHELHLDGTFKCVPSAPPARQLLVFVAVVQDKTMPITYVLMSNRSRELYDEVLEQFKVLAPTLHPAVIMSDYERALQTALIAAYPHAEVVGCFFHYASAVWKKAMAAGYIVGITEERRKAIKMLMALPLVPAGQFVEGFRLIVAWCTENDINLDILFRYMERYWIHTVQPEHISVHNLPRRTNNNSEAFNKVLLNKLRIHPNVFIFLEKLEKFNQITFSEYRQIQTGLRVRRPMGNRYLANDIRIRDAQIGLENGMHTLFHFLEIVAHSVDNLAVGLEEENNLGLLDDFVDDVPINLEEPAAAVVQPNVDIFDEIPAPAQEINLDAADNVDAPVPAAVALPVAAEEPEVGNRCVICLSTPPTHACVPCGHLSICGPCATHLMELANVYERRCPVCRDDINLILRVYF